MGDVQDLVRSVFLTEKNYSQRPKSHEKYHKTVQFNKLFHLNCLTTIKNIIWAFMSTFYGSKRLIWHDLASHIHLLVVFRVQKTQFFHHFLERGGAKKLHFCYSKN